MIGKASPAALGFRVLVVTLALFALSAVDLTGPSLSESAQSTPLTLLVVSLLNALAIGYAVARSHWGGWRLALAVFLVFFASRTLLVAVETVYLAVLPTDVAVNLLPNGFVTAALAVPLAVLMHGRLPSRVARESASYPALSKKEWLGKLLLVAILWDFCFVLFGGLVFLPLAGWLDPAGLAAYGELAMPEWLLAFQAARGAIWALLAVPLIRATGGAGIAVALLFAVPMSGNLLLAAEMSAGLRAAHLTEVFGGNLAFGLIVTWLFGRHHHSPLSLLRPGSGSGRIAAAKDAR